MFGLGAPEMIVLLVIVLVLFGGTKLPQMMKGLGEGMKEFKKATREDDEVQPLNSSTTTIAPNPTSTITTNPPANDRDRTQV